MVITDSGTVKYGIRSTDLSASPSLQPYSLCFLFNVEQYVSVEYMGDLLATISQLTSHTLIDPLKRIILYVFSSVFKQLLTKDLSLSFHSKISVFYLEIYIILILYKKLRYFMRKNSLLFDICNFK